MNEQQLAAVKQALEALESFDGLGDVVTWEKQWKLCIKAHESLQSIISQDALDKKAENARELGLDYDTPLSSFVRSSDEAKAEVMERVIDKATEEQKAVIDCDQCKAVQEVVPPAQEARAWLDERGKHDFASAVSNLIVEYRKAVHKTDKNSEKSFVSRMDAGLCGGAQPAPVPLTDEQIQLVVSQAVSAETLSWLGYKKDADGKYTVPVLSPSDYQFARAIEAAHGITAAPQPVPVKTYHDGKPWPVAPKPWVGLTNEEREQHRDDWRSNIHDKEFRAIEAKLKEKNT